MADPKDLTPSGDIPVGDNAAPATPPAETPAATTTPAADGTAMVDPKKAAESANAFWKDLNKNIPMADVLFQSGVTVAAPPSAEAGLRKVGLAVKGGVVRNDYEIGGSSILLNSDRVIINSRASHTIVAGAEGVALTSPSKVNIDADDSVTIFGSNGFFLGIPNKGEPYEENSYPPPEVKLKEGVTIVKGVPTKAMPTNNSAYEPIVLGLKLANWLDDLLQVIRNAQILTPTGLGAFREDTQFDLSALSSRIKEMLSTYAYVDGWSHETPDTDLLGKAPTKVTKPKTSIKVNLTLNVQDTRVQEDPNSTKAGYYNGDTKASDGLSLISF